jgi:SPP1 gp7 family putative phage head morphogenesis protein
MMATKTPIEQGVMARALSGVGAALRGAADWFGPSTPIAQQVTGAQVDSVRGRQFDFPVAFNRVITPRSNESVSFGQLRALADNCDVLRLVIETRKDQMAKMKWVVKPVNDGVQRDQRCDDLEAFFKFPDKENNWDDWLRMLLEEMLVTDAATLYCRMTNGGDPYAFEPLDGATIKRVLDERGRTPMGPGDIAYQQILKGIPAINYSTEELLYRPRNKRVWKVYGFSPVEQVVFTVNTALRRAVHVMQHYTEGNVPEALIGVPENWTVAQIAEFQTYWDSILEGNTAERRHAKFVPGAMKYQPTKDSVLKDDFDEWLARVVCFAFSIAPTPFIKSVNRATAESAHDAAISEGLAPVMQWVVNLMNFIIQFKFGYTDICFDWDTEEAQDPLERAQVDQIYLQAKVITVDEVRQELGRDPLTSEQLEQIKALNPAPPSPFGAPGAGDTDGDDPPPGKAKKDDKNPKSENALPDADVEKGVIAKVKKRQPGPINPDRATVVKLENKLAATVHTFFKVQVARVAAQVTKIAKADESDEVDAGAKARAKKAVISIDWDELIPKVQPILEEIAAQGASDALDQVGVDDDEDIYGAQVAAWAQDRAAEMVGMKWVDGELVENPNAEWVISDSTRDMIQGMVSGSIDDGATMDELSDQLQDAFAFSEERATMIARTETRMADMGGQMEAYQASGVVQGTEWSTANDDLVSDICQGNADAGIVPLGDAYPSGDTAPPGHPNCRCCVIATLTPETDDDSSSDE